MSLLIPCKYISLSKNFGELQHLLKITNKNFDVIAITETRIRKDVTITSKSTFT